MPDETEVLTPEELQLPNDIQAQLRIGRKAAKDAESLQAQIKQMEKQSAIDRAGVPEHPARDVVFKEYDGPMDGDSIREYATKMGIVTAPPVSVVTDQETGAMRQVLNAGGGAPPVSNDVDAAIAMRNTKSRAELLGIIGELVETPGFHNRDGLIGVWPEPI